MALPALLPALGAGVSTVSGISSLIGGRKEDKNQKRLLRAQTALLKQQAAQGAEMYGRYRSEFLPLEDEYLDMVRAGVQPDYQYEAARARTTVGRQYDQEQARMGRELARLGIDPSSPRYQSLMRETSLRRAADMAGATNVSRRAASERARDTGFAQLGSAVNLGRSSLSTALGQTSSAVSGMGGVAGAYGDRAAGRFGDAASAFQAAGYLGQRALRGGQPGSYNFDFGGMDMSREAPASSTSGFNLPTSLGPGFSSQFDWAR